MEKVRFIGDIHGKFMTYRNLVDGVYENVGGGAPAAHSIQIGDYGLGFDSVVDSRQLQWALENPQHKFIRGNHDNPAVCAESPNWIEDGFFDSNNGIFYLGGAWSIDMDYRVENKTWWPDEEVSYERLIKLIEFYEKAKPKIVITHDCPTSVAFEMFLKHQVNPFQMKTRTGEALQEMFECWKPELHIFGHWHQTMKVNIDGTDFVCLGELAYMDLDIESCQILDGIKARTRAGTWVKIPEVY